MLERLQELVNGNEGLVRRGRFVDARVMIGLGDADYRLSVRAGRIEAVEPGPFPMSDYDFALRAPLEEWRLFWQPVPPPGSNDLIAMRKRRVLTIEGNLQPLMANLRYFKEVMASLRGAGGAA